MKGWNLMHFKRVARTCILITILLTGCSTKTAIPEETNQISAIPTVPIESLTAMPSQESEPTVSIDPELIDNSVSPTPMVSSEPISTAVATESEAVSAAPSQSSAPSSTVSPNPSKQVLSKPTPAPTPKPSPKPAPAASPKPSPKPAPAASPKPTPTPSSPQNDAPKSAANPNARMMSMTFLALIQMDKTEGLAITKEQAAPMQTIVQEAITKGELTADAQTKLEANLTADQKKFLVDNAANMPQRPGAGKGQVPPGDAPQGSPGLGGKGNGGAGGNMKNSGPDLLALLKSKS
jgi:hypothetical protein